MEDLPFEESELGVQPLNYPRLLVRLASFDLRVQPISSGSLSEDGRLALRLVDKSVTNQYLLN
jgi:hypothetical protein